MIVPSFRQSPRFTNVLGLFLVVTGAGSIAAASRTIHYETVDLAAQDEEMVTVREHNRIAATPVRRASELSFEQRLAALELGRATYAGAVQHDLAQTRLQIAALLGAAGVFLIGSIIVMRTAGRTYHLLPQRRDAMGAAPVVRPTAG